MVWSPKRLIIRSQVVMSIASLPSQPFALRENLIARRSFSLLLRLLGIVSTLAAVRSLLKDITQILLPEDDECECGAEDGEE
jgi:hypothetical protein